MSQRKTVPCPLGNQCPSGGKHYPDSSIYAEHMRLSNGNSNSTSGRTQEQERERQFNPMADQVEDPDVLYNKRVELRNRPVTEWVEELRERSENGENIKLSTIVGFSSDQEEESFTVSYKTGEQIVFHKDPANDDSFVAIKYKGTISPDNIVNEFVVPADQVVDEVDKEDIGNRRMYMGLGAAAIAANAHDWGRDKRSDDMRELEPNMNNNILYRWLNKFLTSAFSIFK